MPELQVSTDHRSAETEWLSVELVYAKPDEQVLIALKTTPGTTVEAAIQASGLLSLFPEIDLAELRAGIFGREVALNRPLKLHDRIEIYRPLQQDPKDARRLKAAKQ